MKLRYILPLLATLLFCGCESKLDIVPKGQITLRKTSELELMLNQEYKFDDSPCESLGMVCGESLGMFNQVSAILSQPNTCAYAHLTGDETVDRATLTVSDMRYNNIYKFINHVNVIINYIDEAEGDELRKPSIKAEALVMRAYLHWIAVCIYARQYDEATASQLGGIAYVTDLEVTEQKTKLSLEETYACILQDVSDEVIALLPESRGSNMVRGDKAWGNAVRAMVLFQMKHYDDALPYAQEAIRLRPFIFDRSSVKTTGTWQQPDDTENNFLYMEGAVRVSPSMEMLTLETAALMEPDDYVLKYSVSSGWNDMMGEMYSGISGVKQYSGWDVQCNVYGLTTEQLYYVAAECLIRAGSIKDGLDLVDKVRGYRVEEPAPSVATDEAGAMKLLQRAKWIECLNTPFNFFDMKRWNSEPDYRRTITRKLGSYGSFSISPDSKLWVMPFPVNAVQYNNSLTQNY